MHLPELIRWGLAIPLAILGVGTIYGNYAIMYAGIKHGKSGSLVALLGAVFLAGAMLLCPVRGVRKFAWVPFVVDVGSLLLLLNCIYFFGIKKGHKP